MQFSNITQTNYRKFYNTTIYIMKKLMLHAVVLMINKPHVPVIT